LEQLPVEPENPMVMWDWSPDGKKLIGTDSAGHVVCYSFETKQYEKILDNGSYPMWLADGVRFLYLAGDKIYLSDIVTKRAREILPSQEMRLRSVGISRDGQLIYYSLYSGESDIWLLDLQ
jgi:Tol biopolymer transport system component